MTAATRRRVGRGISNKSRGSGSGRKGAARSRPFAALCALALTLGLGLQLGSIQQAVAAPAPVGNGFVVTPGDLAFILKQIRIAEMHSTTLTASDPCGTMLAQPGDGIPDEFQVPDVITSYGLRTAHGSRHHPKAAA